MTLTINNESEKNFMLVDYCNKNVGLKFSTPEYKTHT
jgi:hypothetical protein